MDNFDFVGHLANTYTAYEASVEIVDSFMRAYYREIQAVEEKWFKHYEDDALCTEAFREINEVFGKYWLASTRFTEYWQPSLAQPTNHAIANENGVTVFQDMLGNFIAVVVNGQSKKSVYLLSVVRGELKIINQFF